MRGQVLPVEALDGGVGMVRASAGDGELDQETFNTEPLVDHDIVFGCGESVG